MAKVVGAVIPEQQNDRLRQFVEALEAKIQDLDSEPVEARFQEPEFIDLLQESLTQAVRAVSKERIEHIAEIVHQSLSDQDRRYIHFKKLLYLLKELNNLEVLMLCSYGRRHDNDFQERHRDTTQVVKPAMGCAQEDSDNFLVREAHRAHLVRLELLRPRFQKPKKGQLPEIDEKTGMMKVKGYDITPLGRLLLRTIGEPDGF
jgi:transcriptional regulator NrdR family protein